MEGGVMDMRHLRKQLAVLKLQFLEEREGAGGSTGQFEDYAYKKVESLVDLEGVIRSTARQVFQSKRSVHDERQLVLDGHALPDVLVYNLAHDADDDADAETMQILTHHATVYHFVLQDDIVQANAQTIVLAAQRHAAQRARLIELCEGDTSRLIRDVT